MDVCEAKDSPLSPLEQTAADEQNDCIIIKNDEVRAHRLLENITRDIQEKKETRQQDVKNVIVMDLTEDDSSVGAKKQENPSIQVLFMNTDIGRKYRHEIEKFIQSLMTAESRDKSQEPLPTIQPRPNLQSEDSTSKTLDETTVIGSVQVYKLFMTDRLGWPMIANSSNQTAGIDIPQYTQQYETDPYPPPQDDEIVETKPITKSKMCFNCEGKDHEARNCLKKLDKRRIQKNRAKFVSSGQQYGRYHKDETSGRLKPGVISETLRKALGLKSNELPRHVYRMRDLGYPPGWLLEAEASNSGLAMFDKHGREVDLDGDMMEDGQVPEHRIRDESNLKYNAEQLIAYPGFNVPCPVDVIDEALNSKSYPRIRPEHSLDVMSSKIDLADEEDAERYGKKRSHYDTDRDDNKRIKTIHLDMDVSDDDADVRPPVIEIVEELPPLPPDEYIVVDEVSSGEDVGRNSSSYNGNIDETLSALEEQKQKLLAELSEMEGISSSNTTQPRTDDSNSQPREDNSLLITNQDENLKLLQSTPVSHQSLHRQETTPVLQLGEYAKLPSYDKFSQGITEHLPYENLPNSTGAYEKMSDVMKNVKEKMTQIRFNRKKRSL